MRNRLLLTRIISLGLVITVLLVVFFNSFHDYAMFWSGPYDVDIETDLDLRFLTPIEMVMSNSESYIGLWNYRSFGLSVQTCLLGKTNTPLYWKSLTDCRDIFDSTNIVSADICVLSNGSIILLARDSYNDSLVISLSTDAVNWNEKRVILQNTSTSQGSYFHTYQQSGEVKFFSTRRTDNEYTDLVAWSLEESSGTLVVDGSIAVDSYFSSHAVIGDEVLFLFHDGTVITYENQSWEQGRIKGEYDRLSGIVQWNDRLYLVHGFFSSELEQMKASEWITTRPVRISSTTRFYMVPVQNVTVPSVIFSDWGKTGLFVNEFNYISFISLLVFIGIFVALAINPLTLAAKVRNNRYFRRDQNE